jgi:hypothetical protein
MLCTRCHHDIHRQGWGIQIRDGRVWFIPPPDIDPTQTPRLGGLAAITFNDTDGADPPRLDTRAKSVPNSTTRGNSARKAA